ncbi:unnamed protein product [Rotaria magnacalcarata]|uniref:Uncharacterized protein n=1 Tax=Rotaria magnacalcarata TaxID=392030 RepID=A0A816Z9X1_9BILA|nr:unnamed protein product [Rotaria magnacalcarata]
MLYRLSSMLQKCSFNGKVCNETDFISFVSSTYGLCYTFNTKLKDRNYDNIRDGSENGGGDLQLGLYVHSHQYVPYVNDGIGIVSLVHDNTQLPLIESAGIELTSGQKHELGYIKKTAFLRLHRIRHVLISYRYEQCGYVSRYLWSSHSVVEPEKEKIILAPLCTTNYDCYTATVGRLLTSEVLMNKYCSDCSLQSLITNFIAQTSALLLPFKWQTDEIKEFVEKSDVALSDNWTIDWREHIQTNYLVINEVRETNAA